MNYQVLCTFDLKNATSKNYEDAYAALNRLGLTKVQKGTPNNAVIPTTTVLGVASYENTNSAGVAVAFRDAISKEFKTLKLTSEIFVTAGQDGSWASSKT